MLTKTTEQNWDVMLEVFRGCLSRRGDKGRDDLLFLRAMHHLTVHNITWRALPAEYVPWNSVWKRFSRLSRSGVFEAFFQALEELSPTAHLVQMFDSTVVRAHGVGRRRKRGQHKQALGRSQGGFSCKVHLKTDFGGLSLGFHLTGGEVSDSTHRTSGHGRC